MVVVREWQVVIDDKFYSEMGPGLPFNFIHCVWNYHSYISWKHARKRNESNNTGQTELLLWQLRITLFALSSTFEYQVYIIF